MALTDSSLGELLFGSGSTITQNTGSSNTVLVLLMGSSGTGATPVAYNLAGGSLTASFAYVGDDFITVPAAATFTQSGGNSSFGTLDIGESGTGPDLCTLSTGTMTVISAINLYAGTFHQSGGTLSFPTFSESGGAANFDKGLNLTSSTVNLSGGTLTTPSITGSGSHLNWTDGALVLSNQVLDVTTATSDPDLGGFIYGSSLTLGNGMSLSLAPASIAEYEFGNGSTITQNTGSSNTMYELIMGSTGTGTLSPVQYALEGGALTATYASIGYNRLYTGPGSAAFTQSGGTASIGTLNVGIDGGTGSYSLSSGTLTVSSYIDMLSAGSLQQSGGTLTSPVTGNSGTMTQTLGTAALGILSGTGSLSVGGGSGAASTTATQFTQGSISVASNGLFTVLAGSNFANSVSTLSVTGSGQLDLTNNHMFIDYGSGPDPIASIAGYLKSGYAGGTWRGPGIVSSSANGTYGVGYADSADPGNPAGLATDQIEIKYTLLGDADLDGSVTGTDFTILASNLGKSVTGWDEGDFNYDGVVNGIDFTELVGNLGKSASGADVVLPASDYAAIDAFAAANGLMADVPEPTTLGLLGLAAAGVLARRRRTA